MLADIPQLESRMGSLVDEVTAATGVARPSVEKAVAIIASFIAREAPVDKVDALFARLPEARTLAALHPNGGAGLLGVFNDLTSAGLGMSEMQSVVMSFVKAAKAEAGDAPVDAVIRAIPGLGQFL
jgi:hypothetical protein